MHSKQKLQFHLTLFSAVSSLNAVQHWKYAAVYGHNCSVTTTKQSAKLPVNLLIQVVTLRDACKRANTRCGRLDVNSVVARSHNGSLFRLTSAADCGHNQLDLSQLGPIVAPKNDAVCWWFTCWRKLTSVRTFSGCCGDRRADYKFACYYCFCVWRRPCKQCLSRAYVEHVTSLMIYYLHRYRTEAHSIPMITWF